MLSTARAGLRQGYVPVAKDPLFASLCAITDVMEQIQVPYVLTGGSLLGAIREGDLIDGDSDWDIDVRADHVPKIMHNQQLFIDAGYTPDISTMCNVRPLIKGRFRKKQVTRGLVKFVDVNGKIHGDFFTYELFRDGILRQVNIAEQSYFNAKMSYPAWFFENPEWAEIRGRRFRVPAEPEVYLERMYGPLWRTPLKRFGDTIPPGYNFAGAFEDADIEKSIDLALSKGWVPDYPDAPLWPPRITHAAAGSADWIHKHEVLDILPDTSGQTPQAHAALQSLLLRQEVRKLRDQLAYEQKAMRRLRGRVKRLRTQIRTE